MSLKSAFDDSKLTTTFNDMTMLVVTATKEISKKRKETPSSNDTKDSNALKSNNSQVSPESELLSNNTSLNDDDKEILKSMKNSQSTAQTLIDLFHYFGKIGNQDIQRSFVAILAERTDVRQIRTTNVDKDKLTITTIYNFEVKKELNES